MGGEVGIDLRDCWS